MLETKIKGLSLQLRMTKFDDNILQCIKSLPFREYDPIEKTWTVPIFEREMLLDKFRKAGLTELELPDVGENKYLETELNLEIFKAKPYQHQIEGAKFLLYTQKCILADEMGCGKTLTAIIAAVHVAGPKLILCPASLKLNWAKEIKSALKQPPQINILGTSNIVTDAEWYIVNYDVLEKYIDTLLNIKPAVLILDEAHYIKAVSNSGKPDSKRAELALELAKNIPYVFLLTGTPITSRPRDLYNLLRAIEHPLGKSKFFDFGKRYCNGKQIKIGSRYVWDFSGASNTKELHSFLKPYMLRRTKDQILDLPPKTRHFIPVEVDLKEYKKKLAEYLSQRGSTYAEELVMLNAMKKLLAEQKIDSTIEFAENIIEEEGAIVIFTNYKSVIEALTDKFKDNCVVIDGSTPQQKRQEAVEMFQDGKVQVFIGNLQAAGVGITLTRAKSMIINDFDWVPATHIQAEDRIHRISQEQKTNIYYLYADGAEIEEHLVNTLESKLRAIESIIDGERKKNIRNTSMLDDIIKKLRENTPNK